MLSLSAYSCREAFLIIISSKSWKSVRNGLKMGWKNV